MKREGSQTLPSYSGFRVLGTSCDSWAVCQAQPANTCAWWDNPGFVHLIEGVGRVCARSTRFRKLNWFELIWKDQLPSIMKWYKTYMAKARESAPGAMGCAWSGRVKQSMIWAIMRARLLRPYRCLC